VIISAPRVRDQLKEFDFEGLFIEELGWDYHPSSLPLEVIVDGEPYVLDALAEKRGMTVYLCPPGPDGEIPPYATRRKIERQVAKAAHEHIIIFTDDAKSTQVWQWVRREPGRPAACWEQTFYRDQRGDPLIQRLDGLAFELDEEEELTIVDVSGRVRAAFDVERVTKGFYDLFKREHDAFLDFIEGIAAQDDKEWYASIMLNRLMFVYFIQKKGFLDSDTDYLRNRMSMMRERQGEDRFLTFYRRFLLRLFHEGLGREPARRAPALDELLGEIPYLNGGLFELHELERENPEIHIPDEAFVRIFNFFDGYRWHLDERPLRADNEINPDVLGYIFEKYINQKDMGAYYTKEDVTGYITENTLIPYLFDDAEKECAIAFRPDAAMWGLIPENPDRYIYEVVRKGVDLTLPEEISAGVDDVSKRGDWNRPADEEYALPTETWREHVARRQRCKELRTKLGTREINSIDDFVNLNLDIRQFAQDVVENCEGSEFLRAFYRAIRGISILDPTCCGSGAFLFAALNVLEPLYEACLERMQRFVDEDQSGERYADFHEVLADVNRHPNRRYFVLKSIIVGNLYGVDIMEEAVETARLRLFLKLMAQIEGVDEVEPLPDIDFNLRAGNTLVGFATLDEVREALSSKLDFDNATAKIEEQAATVDVAFRRFRRMQVEDGADYEELGRAKKELRGRLRKLNAELNRYLSVEYGVDPKDTAAFESWRESHKPFHWLVEFYGILRGSGFDVIIGNPPYVEYKDVKGDYTVHGLSTESCGDLYAFIVERCYDLTSTAQRIGLIVPISIFGTDGFAPLQRLSIEKLDVAWVSCFANRPAQLFDGAQKRLTILIGKRGNAEVVLYRTSYLRWKREERPALFAARMQYVLPAESFRVFPASLEKLGSVREVSAFSKLLAGEKLVGAIVSPKNNLVFYTRKFGYFLAFLDFVPGMWNLKTGERKLPSGSPCWASRLRQECRSSWNRTGGRPAALARA
jgi:hypothetical protein